MKKIILTIIAVFTLITVNAQFGAKAGINHAKFSGDIDATSFITGFQVGILYEYKVSDQFSLQPEIYYSTQGSEDDDAGDLDLDFDYKVNYLNIPIMAKYYLSSDGGFNFQAGPQFGLLLSGTLNQTGSTSEIDIKDDLKSLYIGVNFGLGYKFSNGLLLDARYNLGLSDIADERASGDDSKITNTVINFTVGYAFN